MSSLWIYQSSKFKNTSPTSPSSIVKKSDDNNNDGLSQRKNVHCSSAFVFSNSRNTQHREHKCCSNHKRVEAVNRIKIAYCFNFFLVP